MSTLILVGSIRLDIHVRSCPLPFAACLCGVGCCCADSDAALRVVWLCCGCGTGVAGCGGSEKAPTRPLNAAPPGAQPPSLCLCALFHMSVAVNVTGFEWEMCVLCCVESSTVCAAVKRSEKCDKSDTELRTATERRSLHVPLFRPLCGSGHRLYRCHLHHCRLNSLV